jgi:hypothetical protein
LLKFLFVLGIVFTALVECREPVSSGVSVIPAPWYPRDPVDPGLPGNAPYPDPTPAPYPQPEPVPAENQNCCFELERIQEELERLRKSHLSPYFSDRKEWDSTDEGLNCESLIKRMGYAVYNYNFDRHLKMTVSGRKKEFEILLNMGYIRFIPREFHRFKINASGEGHCLAKER